MQGFKSLQGHFIIGLFKNVVAQFIGFSLCHCGAGEVSRSNLVSGMRLPGTFQVLAMTKREGSDKSGSYKNPKIEREIKIKQPLYDKEVLWLSFLK